MTRLVTLGILGLALALPAGAFAGEPSPRPAAAATVAESASPTRREPVWAMPHRKAEHRRRFSRDLDPRFRELLAVPTLTR
jgi:hypothetical protein